MRYNTIMKKPTIFALGIFLLPLITHAQTLQVFLANFLVFTNGYLIPFLLGVAFLFFIINVVRFFVIGSTSEEGRDKAKALAIYGVAAFVFIVIFWGLINLFVFSFGFNNTPAPAQDYVECKKNGTC